MSDEPIPNDPDYRRDMRRQAKWAKRNRTRIDAEWDAIPETPRHAAHHIASVRDTDPERWAELQGEWE